MKKHSRNLLLVLLAILTMFTFAACGTVSDPEMEPTAVEEKPAPTAVTEEPKEAATPITTKEETAAPTAEATKEVPTEEPLVIAESLDINVALGNNQRTLTYQQATPLELPDGTIISQGMLKPTWQYIQEQIGIQIKDVAIQDQSSGEMMDVSAATSFDGANISLAAAASETIS